MKPELLSPAGDLQCIRSAVAAGCNAVYFGGQDFNARQGAGNLTLDDMAEAVHLCRLHGVKTLLTVNTIVKESEWERFIRSFDAMASTGIDGVIVQDMGVAAYIRENYPEIELHASTQMSIHSIEGVRFLQSQGFRRVVLARELSLEEVREIRSQTDMELEVFIHGALCYSVSGQCLLSSLIGGRSGNRGRCAQPCRLPYRLEGGSFGHLMNLKDMCSLPLIEELTRIGVNSLKIEGRLKSPEYVYGVTRSYRLALDGKLDADTLQEETLKLKALFNRGGFSEGYWRKSGPMVEPGSPKHQGLLIGRTGKVRKGRIYIDTQETLHPDDVLEIRLSKPPYPSYQLKSRNLDGGRWWIAADQPVKEGTDVYRLRDEALMASLRDPAEPLIPVRGEAWFELGQPARLCVTDGRLTAEATGEITQPARSAALTEESVKRSLCKTGGTAFSLQDLQLHIEKGSFLPVSALNALRRGALRALEEQMTADRRERRPFSGTVQASGHTAGRPELELIISTAEQWEAAVGKGHRIYFRLETFTDAALLDLIPRTPLWGIAMPYYMRPDHRRRIQRLQEAFTITDVLACNLGQLDCFDADTRLHLHYTVPVTNQKSAAAWRTQACTVTLSTELSADELSDLKGAGQALLVYGKTAVMISRQCMQKEGDHCLHADRVSLRSVTDRKEETWTLELHCPDCYTVLYASRPVWMADRSRTLARIPADVWRLFFLDEDAPTTSFVIASYEKAQKGQRAETPDFPVIRGHFTNACL